MDNANKRLSQGVGQEHVMAYADQDIIRVLFESPFRAKMAANHVEANQEGLQSVQAHGRDRVGRDVPPAKVQRGT